MLRPAGHRQFPQLSMVLTARWTADRHAWREETATALITPCGVQGKHPARDPGDRFTLDIEREGESDSCESSISATSLKLEASPQQGDLRLSSSPSGQGAGGGSRTRDREIPADLRADSLSTMPLTPPVREATANHLSHDAVCPTTMKLWTT
ncbi:hypothetical protein PoB_006157700 [Plakobranchus ocellatus]|uniref:Uncharacterized protein n=1 Tax=Plakobranchus ocellatus TaxID=259542 RepID=A0AAV4CT42_9GAST|nr:hypothetical protein PoB_006157700 [Plakobranchus ocellatus]